MISLAFLVPPLGIAKGDAGKFVTARKIKQLAEKATEIQYFALALDYSPTFLIIPKSLVYVGQKL